MSSHDTTTDIWFPTLRNSSTIQYQFPQEDEA